MAQKKITKTTTHSRAKRVRNKRVDYYPNKMTLAVSVLGGTSLVLLALLAAMTMNNG